MKTLTLSALAMALVSSVAAAQTMQPVPPAVAHSTAGAQVMTSIPGNGVTVTHWYKQAVYDPSDSRIGEIDDVLIDRDGKVLALIVGVGGFLGIGEKHVAVPQSAVQVTNKNNNNWYLVMNTTKDALKSAPGFRYDRTSMAWMPESAAAPVVR
jgi:hypothetical protein